MAESWVRWARFANSTAAPHYDRQLDVNRRLQEEPRRDRHEIALLQGSSYSWRTHTVDGIADDGGRSSGLDLIPTSRAAEPHGVDPREACERRFRSVTVSRQLQRAVRHEPKGISSSGSSRPHARSVIRGRLVSPRRVPGMVRDVLNPCSPHRDEDGCRSSERCGCDRFLLSGAAGRPMELAGDPPRRGRGMAQPRTGGRRDKAPPDDLLSRAARTCCRPSPSDGSAGTTPAQGGAEVDDDMNRSAGGGLDPVRGWRARTTCAT